MKLENPDALILGATPVRPSRREILLTAALYFESRPADIFRPVHEIEFHSESVARSRPTLGTAFEPIVNALNAAGVPTEQTLGSVIDNLPMTRKEAHEYACNCNGYEMTGAALAKRLRTLAES